MIKIDVVSDVACPWCYVGMKRLEKALATIPDIETEINWQPFQLDPNIPAEGRLTKPYYVAKFGSEEKVNEVFEHMQTVGDAEGLSFDFKNMHKTMNSLALHVLMHVAEQEGFKSELKLRFFKAYFEEIQDLSEPQNLANIMAEYSWTAEKTNEILSNNTIKETVKQKIAYFQSRGVQAVPFFIFNDTYGLSGAQPPHVLAETLKQIQTDMAAKSVVVDGESCDMEAGGC
jgi:predicted DsbA family dithiol-disulfide isomerase